MNRLAQSGLAATAVAAILASGGLALGGGDPPSAPTPSFPWGDRFGLAVNGEKAGALAAFRTGASSIVWNGGIPLAAVSASSLAGAYQVVRGTTDFRLWTPIADPTRLSTAGARATLRFRVTRTQGWVQGEVDATALGGRHQLLVLAGDGAEQRLTLWIPAAALRSLGRAEVRGRLRLIARNGGAGTLAIESLEIAQ